MDGIEFKELFKVATETLGKKLPIECREQQNIEYATHAYVAGLYDAFWIMVVLFPNKWDIEEIQKLFS